MPNLSLEAQQSSWAIQTLPPSSHFKKPLEPGHCALNLNQLKSIFPSVSFQRAGVESKGLRDLFSSPHITYTDRSGEPTFG